MPSEETRRVVQGFLADADGCWLADDVVLHDAARGEQLSGRAEVGRHMSALRDMTEMPAVVVEDHRASATWRSLSASYEVAGGEITRIRVFYDEASALRLPAPRGNTTGTARL